jgi:anti-anti-sigma factor
MDHFTLKTRESLFNREVEIVDLEGSLNINTAGGFESALVELFNQERYKIILNMENLTYVSSTGFGMLFKMVKFIPGNRGAIKITHISPELYRTFDLLDLPSAFHILKTEQEAVQEFCPLSGTENRVGRVSTSILSKWGSFL